MKKINTILETFGFAIIKTKSRDEFLRNRKIANIMVNLFADNSPNLSEDHILKLHLTESQLGQDLAVLKMLDWKSNGFFVEVGASDGELLSNTNLLEKSFGWRGILVEANPRLAEIAASKRSSKVINAACWHEHGSQIALFEPEIAHRSTVKEQSDPQNQTAKNQFVVNTVTLDRLLSEHDAPTDFDFISIDVEGAEPDVLRGFDIAHWRPKVLTIEHNYATFRADVLALMEDHGYQRFYERSSRFDDWYFRKDIIS